MTRQSIIRCNLLLLTLWAFSLVEAQDSIPPKKWQLEAYVDGYFGYDFADPADHQRPPFLYNHTRHQEANINLAYLRAAYSGERVRMNLSLAAGTYMNANYAAEPSTLRNLMEANVGLRLSKKKKLWLDLGILPSHIGFESAVHLDCWTLSRSIVAENSPYYESGIRLSYETDDGRWTMNLNALNGWQTITRVDGNSMMSWGAQVQFKPGSKWLVNYSNFIGTVYPDSTRRIRHYHNFYARWQPSDQWGLIAGFDYGQEQKTKNGDGWNNWFTPVVIARYLPSAHWAMAARLEYFADPAAVVIIHPGNNEFKTTGLSFNLDYMPVAYAALRMEYRWLHGQDPVFAKNSTLARDNQAILLSLAIRLQ